MFRGGDRLCAIVGLPTTRRRGVLRRGGRRSGSPPFPACRCGPSVAVPHPRAGGAVLNDAKAGVSTVAVGTEEAAPAMKPPPSLVVKILGVAVVVLPNDGNWRKSFSLGVGMLPSTMCAGVPPPVMLNRCGGRGTNFPQRTTGMYPVVDVLAVVP